ncbi:hypothetical protein QPK31_23440 [Massilia sp. YIM B02769]|uniref:hypothetical protein n=1 Tax=Massilia sp. YIM B02769 TaxID=3050129 RepID=UPI0025B6E184|nr:hypothetical protein [Massilia sp. YIM B02769]MDN4061178.1 hypothetical protein [Massilia sp. YIM B02769]
MNDHQQITAERGRRAADLRAAAVALLEQQAIAAGVMLDLDSDQVVAAGPKAAILYLLSNGAPAATSGDAPDLQQLKALAVATSEGPWSAAEEYADNGAQSGHRIVDAHGRIIIGEDVAPSADEVAYIAAANPAVVLGLIARIERATAAAPASVAWEYCPECGSMETVPPDENVENQYVCAACGQEWHSDIDYTDVVRDHLGNRAASGATASGDELAKWHEPSWQKGYSAGYNDAVGDVRAPSTSTSPAERAASSAGGPGDGAPKFPEPGYSNSLADRVFNLPCNWKGDQALHSAILMGHTMACEQAYNLVMADEQARAAVSAATKEASSEGSTKPTADLSKLTRYDIAFTESSAYMADCAFGDYYRVDDVQSLLATKPAAVPEGWTVEFDKYTPPGTIRLHSAKWGGAFVSKPAADDIGLAAITYRFLSDVIAAAPAASTPAAPVEQQSDSSHVTPPFAAPASQHGANPLVMAELRRWAGNDPGYAAMLVRAAVKEIEELEEVLASRCRAQGGVTNNTDSGNSSASTTGAAQTADDTKLLDALGHASWGLEAFNMPTGGDDNEIGWRVIEYHMAAPHRRTVAEVYEDSPRAAIKAAIESPTPTHSSEAGDA